MRRFPLQRVAILAGAVLATTSTARAARPVVAVFGLEAKGARLGQADLDRLSDYIGAALTESGRYEVVPRSDLKAALNAQKKASYDECYAESCQIEIGKELAAEKSLTGNVSRFGKTCIVSLKLFDLAKATQEAAGTGTGKCGKGAIFESVNTALRKLTGATGQTTSSGVEDPVAAQARLPPSSGADPDGYGALLAKAETAKEASSQRAKRRDAAWALVSKIAKTRALPRAERLGAVRKFLRDFPDDNPQLDAARDYARALEAGQEPAPTPDGMVEVPAGRFVASCHPAADKECGPKGMASRPTHVEGFYIDRTEVTVADFSRCIAAKGCKQNEFMTFSNSRMCNQPYSDRAQHPMNCVSAKVAAAYCKWKGKRLPTGVEWEKAARGSDGRVYPWGDEAVSCRTAVVREPRGAGGCGRKSTWPVGSKPEGASPYGALDMVGNVWEMTSTWFEPGKTKAARGGSSHYPMETARPSGRLGVEPSYFHPSVGFRCAQSM